MRPRVEIEVVGRTGRRERGVDVPDDPAVHFLVRAQRHLERGLGGLDVPVVPAVPVAEPQATQSARALLDREKRVEHVEARDARILAVRDQLAPGAGFANRVETGFDEPEVRRSAVGADDPALAEGLGFVLVVALTRQQDLEAERRIVGARKAQLGRERARRADQEKALVLARVDPGVERLVVLLVHERVLGLRCPEHVPPHAEPEQRAAGPSRCRARSR